jgi:hypothetical protein
MESSAAIPLLHLWDRKLYFISGDSISVVNFDQGLFSIPVPTEADASSAPTFGFYENSLALARKNSAKGGAYVLDLAHPSSDGTIVGWATSHIEPKSGRYLASKEFFWGAADSLVYTDALLIPSDERSAEGAEFKTSRLADFSGTLLCCNEQFAIIAGNDTKKPGERIAKFRTINMGHNSEEMSLPRSGSGTLLGSFIGDRRFIILAGGKINIASINDSFKFDPEPPIACPISRYHMFINYSVSGPYLFALAQAIMKPLDLSIIVFDISNPSPQAEPKPTAKIPVPFSEVPIAMQAFYDAGSYSLFFLTKSALECYQIQ